MSPKIFVYICNNSACGHVIQTTHAPSTAIPCPKCQSMMIRQDS